MGIGLMKIDKNIHFDIKATNMIKGLAICLLVYFHSISFADPATHICTFPMFHSIFTKYGNVCVVFFVILSAYGYTIQQMRRKEMLNVQTVFASYFKRLKNLYKGYWPVFILALILTPVLSSGFMDFRLVYYSENTIESIFRGLINFLGLSHLFFGNFRYSLNQTWWYLSIAILLILIIPFEIYAVQKKPIITSTAITVLVLLFPEVKYIQYLISMLIGTLAAEYNLFERIHAFNAFPYHMIKLISIILLFILWIFARGDAFFSTYSVIADSLFAFASISFLFDYLYSVNIIQRLFTWIGKYSADIFYIHSFIYYYFPMMSHLIYGLKYDFTIWLCTFLISLCVSIILELLKDITGWNRLFDSIKLPASKENA